MRALSLLLVLIVVLFTGFVALNWAAFDASTKLSLGVFDFQAPLGLVMLGVCAGIIVIFAVYMSLWQATILVEARRHAKELQAQRSIAEQAEASRLAELRSLMNSGFRQLSEEVALAQQHLQTSIHENANSTAALISEMDDRISKR